MKMTFNEWRSNYETLTLKEQVDYHNELEKLYPNQAHFDFGFALKVFDLVNPSEVTEAGGWKGDLANEMLNRYDINLWQNIELCDNAILNTNCKHEKFVNIQPKTFDWFDSKLYKGLFLATHFIEHLSNEHFNKLAESLTDVEYVYFEAPIENYAQSWDNYIGTHKLEYGWDEIKNIMKNHEILIENNYCKLFKRIS
jgi:hypothetical protein